MLAKPPLMDGLIVNVHRGLRQEAFEAICNTKLDRGGLAVFGTAGTPKVQSCALCIEASHLRNHRRHWDALGAHRTHHGVVNIHKDHLYGHICLTSEVSGAAPLRRQATKGSDFDWRVRRHCRSPMERVEIHTLHFSIQVRSSFHIPRVATNSCSIKVFRARLDIRNNPSEDPGTFYNLHF